MEELYAAKYNICWYLSFVAPAVILLAATYWHRRWILILGVLLSLSVAVPLRIAAVRVRWNTQNELVDSLEELRAAQAQDPPVMVETALIAPFQALLSAGLWALCGWTGWPRVRARAPAPPLDGQTLAEIASDSLGVCARYVPGILIYLVWLTYPSCVGFQYHNYSTDDPMSDTGSALFLGAVIQGGFVLAALATVILGCIWFAYHFGVVGTGDHHPLMADAIYTEDDTNSRHPGA